MKNRVIFFAFIGALWASLFGHAAFGQSAVVPIEVVTKSNCANGFCQILTGHAAATTIGTLGGKTYFLTNRHVVDGATKPPVVTFAGKRYSVEVVAVHDSADLALLSVKFPGSTGFYYLKISDEMPVDGADIIAESIGYEKRSRLTYRNRRGGMFYNSYFFTGRVKRGHSGGALWARGGDLVGLIYGYSDASPGMSLAVDWSVIRSFVVDTLGAVPGAAVKANRPVTVVETPKPAPEDDPKSTPVVKPDEPVAEKPEAVNGESGSPFLVRAARWAIDSPIIATAAGAGLAAATGGGSIWLSRGLPVALALIRRRRNRKKEMVYVPSGIEPETEKIIDRLNAAAGKIEQSIGPVVQPDGTTKTAPEETDAEIVSRLFREGVELAAAGDNRIGKVGNRAVGLAIKNYVATRFAALKNVL